MVFLRDPHGTIARLTPLRACIVVTRLNQSRSEPNGTYLREQPDPQPFALSVARIAGEVEAPPA
jgi:hypothetical protein